MVLNDKIESDDIASYLNTCYTKGVTDDHYT